MHMKKVLIVDDAAFMRLTLRGMLEKNGFEVIGEAENGVIAITKYKELNPDIVTMDVTMPEMDGIQALKQIIALDGNAKILMLTAMGQERMVREAVIAGARGFIIKPFREEAVISALNKL